MFAIQTRATSTNMRPRLGTNGHDRFLRQLVHPLPEIVNAECFPATPIDRACSNCVVVMKETQPTGVVGMSIDEMQLHRPRQWGACLLACHLYGQLELDLFFAARLPNSREGTRWQHILQTLVCYRLIDPGSEWRLHRQWFEQSAMGDLIGADYSLVEKNALYRCLDKLLEHEDALFLHLRQRWRRICSPLPSTCCSMI